MKRVLIKDIASKAGVVPSTVSLVLNGKAKEMRISDSIAEKIKAVAEAEGYLPNSIAVSLRTGKSKILGLIVEDISNVFFASLAKIIEEEANSLGYKVLYCSTENDTQKGTELIKMLSQTQVDGYIITPSPGMENALKQLVIHKKPLVLMDRYCPGLDVAHVLVNNSEGIKLGMQYLYDKGYKKIAFVTIDLEQVQMQERREGYLAFLQEKNIPVRNEWIYKVAYHYDREQAVAQLAEFISSQSFEAVFFATNYLGTIGLESIKNLKIKIPKDLAVICFDDNDLFRLHDPGITIVQQPIMHIAKTAVSLLMEQVNGENGDGFRSKAVIDASLIQRESA